MPAIHSFALLTVLLVNFALLSFVNASLPALPVVDLSLPGARHHNSRSSPRHNSPFARNRYRGISNPSGHSALAARAGSIPANWALIGCYSDATSPRALASYGTSSSSNTPAWCISTCSAQGYSFAGVEYASQCYCANSITTSTSPSVGQVTSSSDCSQACSGDSSQICGGGNRISIYSYTTPASSTLASGWTSLGCFSDATDNRALQNGYFIQTNSNTPSYCTNLCSGMGYSYAGVEYGSQCFCANSITTASSPSTGQTVSSSQCNMACAGDASQTCGAGNIMQIFQSSASTTTRTTSVGSTTTTTTTTAAATTSSATTTRTTTTVAATTTTSTSAAVTTTTSSTPSSTTWTNLGCYQDGSTRALAAYSTTINALTPATCQTTCAGLGYAYAGVEYSVQCYCGSSIGSSASTIASSNCQMTCGGDSSQMCGGNYAINIYSLSTSTSTSTSSPTTTKATTTTALGTSAVTPTPTTTSTATTISTTTSTSSSSGSWTTLGCYQDGNTRALASYSTSINNLTPALCQSTCLGMGYSFAGTEWSVQCYCGSSVASSAATIAASNCAMSCGGDSTQSCGGNYAIIIYSYSSAASTSGTSKTGTTAATTTGTTSLPATTTTATTTSSAALSTSSSWTNLGCYQDGNTRVLAAYSTTASTMTPASCQSTCKGLGYSYAGVEYSTECYCGSSIASGASTLSASSCSMTCGGDSTQLCGGSYAINIYSLTYTTSTLSGTSSQTTTTTTTTSTRTSTSTSTSTSTATTTTSSAATTTTAAWTNLGCYQDGNTRVLAAYSTTASSLTPASCQSTCAGMGYSYAGVEYSTQCYCGSSLASGATSISSSSCSMTCGGDSTQLCGGNYAINVYSLSSTMSTRTTTTTASTTAVGTTSTTTTTTRGTTTTTSPTTTTSTTTSSSPSPTQPSWGTGSYVVSSNGLSWYNSDLSSGTSGVSATTYSCFGGNVTVLPPQSQWMSFSAMWARQQQYSLGTYDTTTQQTQIYNAIVQVSQESKVDARLILAVVMQESTGNVNVGCTGGYNCGLMQANHGSVSYNASDSAASILQMVRDGTEGTSLGPGYVQYLNGGSSYAYTNCNLGNPYDAARAYNTGSCSTSGNLNCARYGTASYVNDIANRLIGWNGFGSPQSSCGFPAVGCV